jgi:hypothetical protein
VQCDSTPCLASGQAQPRAPRPPLGYEFDPIPRKAVDLVASHVLQPVDVEVLAILLRYRSRLRTSCWTTIGRLAEGIGRSESTIHRSLRRLQSAGLIRHVQIAERGEPDPDEPRNRTGWRFYFAWMDAVPSSAVTPTPCQPWYPPPVSRDTQIETERTPPQRANQDDEDAVVVVLPSIPPEEKTPERSLDAAVEAASSLVERPAAAVGRILKDHPTITPGDVVEAVAIAGADATAGKVKGRAWSYVIGIIGNWALEGRSIAPKAAPKPERTFHRAPAVGEADRESAREAGRQLRTLLHETAS